MTTRTEPDVGRDALLALPGIMGNELVEVASGRVLWGLADVRWYATAWTSGRSMRELRVTEAERAGTAWRVEARRVLRVPAFVPVLRGVEPYSKSLDGARRFVAHPDALREFPYDWRLSVEHNAAKVADDHLTGWRQHSHGQPGRTADMEVCPVKSAGQVPSMPEHRGWSGRRSGRPGRDG